MACKPPAPRVSGGNGATEESAPPEIPIEERGATLYTNMLLLQHVATWTLKRGKAEQALTLPADSMDKGAAYLRQQIDAQIRKRKELASWMKSFQAENDSLYTRMFTNYSLVKGMRMAREARIPGEIARVSEPMSHVQIRNWMARLVVANFQFQDPCFQHYRELMELLGKVEEEYAAEPQQQAQVDAMHAILSN